MQESQSNANRTIATDNRTMEAYNRTIATDNRTMEIWKI